MNGRIGVSEFALETQCDAITELKLSYKQVFRNISSVLFVATLKSRCSFKFIYERRKMKDRRRPGVAQWKKAFSGFPTFI